MKNISWRKTFANIKDKMAWSIAILRWMQKNMRWMRFLNPAKYIKILDWYIIKKFIGTYIYSINQLYASVHTDKLRSIRPRQKTRLYYVFNRRYRTRKEHRCTVFYKFILQLCHIAYKKNENILMLN